MNPETNQPAEITKELSKSELELVQGGAEFAAGSLNGLGNMGQALGAGKAK